MITQLKQRTLEHGATLIEASIGFLIFLIFLGGLFDIGALVYNRATLSGVVTEVTRQAALSRSLSCSDGGIFSAALTQVSSRLQEQGIGGDAVSDGGSQLVSINSQSALELRFNWRVHCIFCQFFGDGVTLQATSQAPLERGTCP